MRRKRRDNQEIDILTEGFHIEVVKLGARKTPYSQKISPALVELQAIVESGPKLDFPYNEIKFTLGAIIQLLYNLHAVIDGDRRRYLHPHTW